MTPGGRARLGSRNHRRLLAWPGRQPRAPYPRARSQVVVTLGHRHLSPSLRRAKLVRSTLARHNGTGALKFQYFGTKELRLPVFSVQLSIHLDVQKKVCVIEAMGAYLSHTSGPAFKHGDRVWCSLTGTDNLHHAVGPETLSRWMRTKMTRCGISSHCTGGSIPMAGGAFKAIDYGWDPRLVLMMGRWQSWRVLNAFYNRAGCWQPPLSTQQT